MNARDSSVAYFAVKSIGLSKVNGSKPCTLLEAARHNLREIQAETGANSHIDPRRARLNQIMAGPSAAADVKSLAMALMAADGVDVARLRRDYSQAIEVVFSLPPDSAIEPSCYFARALDWLNAMLPLPVLSAVVHQDESSVHMHVLLLPLMNGKYVGSSPIGREALKRLREGFFAKVAGPAGLQRQGAKLRGAAKQWAVAAVMRECERRGLPEKNGQLWAVFAAALESSPLDALKALDIDLQSIRPGCETLLPVLTEKAIGIEGSPIGFDAQARENQSLTCVGFACQTVSRPIKSDRLSIAREAQQRAFDRQGKGRPAPMSRRSVVVGDDGWTRDRDTDVHDLSGWE